MTEMHLAFIIMRKYDLQLNDYFCSNEITIAIVLNIAKQLLLALQLVHETGFVYNDLKMENIMI